MKPMLFIYIVLRAIHMKYSGTFVECKLFSQVTFHSLCTIENHYIAYNLSHM